MENFMLSDIYDNPIESDIVMINYTRSNNSHKSMLYMCSHFL